MLSRKQRGVRDLPASRWMKWFMSDPLSKATMNMIIYWIGNPLRMAISLNIPLYLHQIKLNFVIKETNIYYNRRVNSVGATCDFVRKKTNA